MMHRPARTATIPHTYGESDPFSLGVEEEFGLLDPRTLNLAPRIEAMLEASTEADLAFLKPELMQGVVEVASPICVNAAEAERSLAMMRSRVLDLAAQSDALVASSGTHPFAKFHDQHVTDRPRYREILEKLQWVARRELIFGLHVHVGIASPELAIHVFNGMRLLLPQLLALTANSPYWQGTDTGLQSARSNVFASFPRSGLPEAYADWATWDAQMRQLMDAGVIVDESYIWWDVRMHPRFGTVEVRVCDGQTRVEDSAAIAAFVQASAAWIVDRHRAGHDLPTVPGMLVEHNKWSATRYGLDGEMLDLLSTNCGAGNGQAVTTRDAIRRHVEAIEPFAHDLGSASQLGWIETMLEGTGADRQRAAADAAGGDLTAVARMLVQDTARIPALA